MFIAIPLLLALLTSSPNEKLLPSFGAFSVHVPESFTSVAPDVRSGQARRYRTILRQASKEQPDFAGHFKIVRWGCGTCCSEFAVLDLRTGKSFFPGFVVACGHPTDFDNPGLVFEYRVDSRLLVVYGAPNEVNADLGTRYYEWTGGKLRLLKTVLGPPRA